MLVNNAGGTIWARLDEVSDLSIYDGLVKLNDMSGVYCTYHALPHLKDARGILVGVSSLAGMSGVPCRTAYAATNDAQLGFFDPLRTQLAGAVAAVADYSRPGLRQMRAAAAVTYRLCS